MKLIFIFFLILFNQFLIADDYFIEKCELISNQSTLKTIFKTSNCSKIQDEILKLQGLSEVISPLERKIKSEMDILSYPWTDSHKYLYGLNASLLNHWSRYESSTTLNEIESVDLFKGFKNLINIAYTKEYFYYSGQIGLCKILKTLPYLKSVTINSEILLNPLVDKCLSKTNLEGVIIRGKFKGFKRFKPKTKIIGIEYFSGELEELKKFTHLKYLGIALTSSSLSGIEALYELTWLTHLSLNISGTISDAAKIRALRNLEHLSITCANKEQKNIPYTSQCPETSKIKDISFLKKLIWLRHLNLSFNQIEDISPLNTLKHLEHLKLRGNKISKINIESLKRLRYLDLSGNIISSKEKIGLVESLTFLNLSGNRIKNTDFLNDLKNLKYLNLSNNPGIEIENIQRLDSLKALNLNGDGGSPEILGVKEFKRLLNETNIDPDYLFETLFYDYGMTPKLSYEKKCKVYPTINSARFSHLFPKLKFLSLKNNLLADEDFSRFRNLIHIDVQNNGIKTFNPDQFPPHIESIVVASNQIRKIPSLENLKRLRQLDLSNNDIDKIDRNDYFNNSLKDLNLFNNLIKDLSPLNPMFSAIYPHGNINILGNPIQRQTSTCPFSDEQTTISKLCREYVLSNKGYIKDTLYFHLPERMDSRKCSITSLAF